ncbi:hypothetical protein SODALDRAFT_326439 [Sodiomyces alkalinus F11]|uniref:FAR-17a/AIG1-like protein n=1 Tax=Sodiomyces alkalinus (strain CBS 110278 / VKM F-3762 / F11) TaxID=1314773 RepID=A0A3N2Q6C0_SODAK|nr:hypothetical protein SODALDRAFT_326439 [Sodiomyces alkalinus F11]ROT42256.1 hypothetical protein SODALDRAFT_326439 [Sodiomyces alkalinus F11]
MSSWLDGFRFGKDPWDPSHRFETSWLLSPWLLFAFRALFCLFIFTSRFFIIGWTCTHAEEGGCYDIVISFAYFTVLTFWGLGFYFAFAALHTFTYARTGRPLLDAFPRPLQALHALFYSSIAVLPIIVTVVYWAVLWGPDSSFASVFAAYSSHAQHSANLAMALFEILIPRTAHAQLLPVHMLWLIVLLALYLALAYLFHAIHGFYPYFFLDPEANGRGILVGFIFGIAVGCLVVFGLVKGLIWIRQRLTEGVLRMDGKFARASASGPDSSAEMGAAHRNGKVEPQAA